MSKKIKKIKLYIKNDAIVKKQADLIKNKLIDNDFLIVDDNYDLALSIGGDGTFIKMIHENKFNNNIYYAGINAGSLGYLIEFELDKLDELIKLLKKNKFKEQKSYILESIVTTKSGITNIKSFNECIIKSNNQLSLKANVLIDNTLLENYIGDGLLFSTPSGSSAYNLSYGGSLVDNLIPAISLTSIAPLNNKIYKSLIYNLVISNKRKIEINFDNNENICFINDGKIININSVKKIEYQLTKTIKYITLNDNSLAHKINNKIIN